MRTRCAKIHGMWWHSAKAVVTGTSTPAMGITADYSSAPQRGNLTVEEPSQPPPTKPVDRSRSPSPKKSSVRRGGTPGRLAPEKPGSADTNDTARSLVRSSPRGRGRILARIPFRSGVPGPPRHGCCLMGCGYTGGRSRAPSTRSESIIKSARSWWLIALGRWRSRWCRMSGQDCSGPADGRRGHRG